VGTPETLVRMNDVSIVYGTTRALSRLDWEVRMGENWAVRGPNGSGKSTLAGLIYADNPQAYANRIEVFGRHRGTGESIWEVKERIGCVSNRLQLGFRTDQPVWKTVASGFFDSTGLFRAASVNQREQSLAVLEGLGIRSWHGRPFSTLSTGEQRLVLIARALVKKPLILILDEPLAGLDLLNRRRVLERITSIGETRRLAMIHITHHEDEIPPCIDRILDLPGNTVTIQSPGQEDEPGPGPFPRPAGEEKTPSCGPRQ
jgi:molybdate transport system ATP-binding protein